MKTDGGLLALVRAVVRDDAREVKRLLGVSPLLAREGLSVGATRAGASDYWFGEINHYLYEGDTALHAAAAGHRVEIARELIRCDAGSNATNRRGAGPLHYAADGGPGFGGWNPEAQAAMIHLLVENRADANMLDKSEVAPLHRAVRQRSAKAVEALLANGALVGRRNGSGSSPLHLAVQNTGKGGSGSAEAREGQREIIRLLIKAGAKVGDKDSYGKTVGEAVRSEWVRELLEELGGAGR